MKVARAAVYVAARAAGMTSMLTTQHKLLLVGKKFNREFISDLSTATLGPPLHHNVVSSSETVKVATRYFTLYYAVLSVLQARLLRFYASSCCKY